jgi:hypothetical protein
VLKFVCKTDQDCDVYYKGRYCDHEEICSSKLGPLQAALIGLTVGSFVIFASGVLIFVMRRKAKRKQMQRELDNTELEDDDVSAYVCTDDEQDEEDKPKPHLPQTLNQVKKSVGHTMPKHYGSLFQNKKNGV